MENEKVVDAKKKKLMPIIAAIVILLIIVVIAILTNKKSDTTPGSENNTPGQQSGEVNEGEMPEGEMPEGETPAEGGELTAEDIEVNSILEGAVTQAPGADLVTTEGKVVNEAGDQVRTDVEATSPEAPKQTMAVAIEEIPLATKLTLDENGFTPKEFRIKKGEALTISLTGSESSSHIFHFSDPLLQAVYINVRPGETRATTFNAPDVAGEYEFFCDFPGHRARGEVGTMIVE